MKKVLQKIIVKPDKNKRYDWLISGPSKAVLDRKKGVLDRQIEGLLQSTNKKDDKNFKASFGFLNERFTLNEIEESEIFWKN